MINKGFTLAEVLITLGIIGVVASITIPTLMNSIQDNQYKVAYKKAYSTASQAWTMANTEGLLSVCTNWGDSGVDICNANNFKAFKSKMKVSKDCGTDTASCWDMSGEKSWDGSWPSTSASSFIDASGMAWSKLQSDNDSTDTPEVLVDTNGAKGPNQYGRDRAIFTLMCLSSNRNGSPYIGLSIDMTNPSDTESKYRCPSIAKHPCYYTSWITGAQ